MNLPRCVFVLLIAYSMFGCSNDEEPAPTNKPIIVEKTYDFTFNDGDGFECSVRHEDVRITGREGTNFEGDNLVALLGPDIILEDLTLLDDTHLVVTFKVADIAILGEREIIIKNDQMTAVGILNILPGKETLFFFDEGNFFEQNRIYQNIRINGLTTGFSKGTPLFDFGEGITNITMNTIDDRHATVSFSIDKTVVFGKRKITITNDRSVATGRMTIVDQVTPTFQFRTKPEFVQGQRYSHLALIGNHTQFISNTAIVDFGKGITDVNFTASDPTHGILSFMVEDDARLGNRIVNIVNNDVAATGILNIKSKSSITFSDQVFHQGESYTSIAITGVGTDFNDQITTFDFGDSITNISLYALSATEATLSFDIAWNASIGRRLISITNGNTTSTGWIDIEWICSSPTGLKNHSLEDAHLANTTADGSTWSYKGMYLCPYYGGFTKFEVSTTSIVNISMTVRPNIGGYPYFSVEQRKTGETSSNLYGFGTSLWDDELKKLTYSRVLQPPSLFSGEYFIIIPPNVSETTSYDLEITVTPFTCPTDSYDNGGSTNYTFSSAATITPTQETPFRINGTTCIPTRDDYFKFSVSEQSVISVDFDFESTYGFYNVRLYDETAKELVRSYASDYIQFASVFVDPGGSLKDYYLRVRQGDPDYEGHYTVDLTVSRTAQLGCINDVYEGSVGNDDPTNAFVMTLGNTYNGIICHGEFDIFEFTTPPDLSHLYVYLDFEHDNGDLDMILLDKPELTGDAITRKSASTSDNESVDSRSLSASFWIVIHGYGGRDSNSYALTAVANTLTPLADNNEPDEKYDDAAPLGDTPIHSAVNYGNGDLFSIEAETGDLIEVRIDFNHNDANLVLALIDSWASPFADPWWGFSDSDQQDFEMIRYIAPQPNTYYFGVFSDEYYRAAAYTITGTVKPFMGCSEDAGQAFQSSFLDAPVYAGLVKGMVICPFQSDYYLFYGHTGERIQATVSFNLNTGGELGAAVLDYDSYTNSYDQLAEARSFGDNELLEWNVKQAGWYWLAVESDLGGMNSYDLNLDILAPVDCKDDVYYPLNQEMASAITLDPDNDGKDSLVGLSLCQLYEVDWYKFEADAGQTIQAWVEFNNAIGDVDLYLVDAAQNILFPANGAGPNTEHVRYDVLMNNWYYLAVYMLHGNEQISHYSLGLEVQ